MADTQYQLEGGPKHQFHLVDPSPWPLLTSLAVGILAAGAVLWMHDVQWKGIHFGVKGVILGFLFVCGCAWGWWRDVVNEATYQKAHSPIAKIGFRYGMVLFIASEVMFFAAFFWAFFDASLFPNSANEYLKVAHTGGSWPPEGVKTFNPFDLPLMMTLILLLSGCTCTWAHQALIDGETKEAGHALGVTVLLGVIFTIFQGYEYAHAAFGFKDGIYSSTFYMATGFHGVHVIIGTIFLAVCWWRTVKGHFTSDSHFGFEAAAWYWHFVDVVWLFLFVAIYWWGGGVGTHH